VIELHESFVQGCPSLQVEVMSMKTQPVAGVHVSVVQALWSSQRPSFDALPARQVSCVVQASRSSQALPSVGVPPQTPPLHVPPEAHGLSPHAAVLLTWKQPEMGSHESLVHGLPSSH